MRPWARWVRAGKSISVASRGSFADRTGACSLAGSIGYIRTTAVPIALGLVIADRRSRSTEHTDQATRTALCSERRPQVKNNVPMLKFEYSSTPQPIERRDAVYRVDS